MNHHYLNFTKYLLEDKSWPQKYHAVLEHELRKVVKDVVEQTIQRSSHLISRPLPTQMEISDQFRPYKLKFERKLRRRFYTDNKVEAEGSAPITIMLLDALSGQPVVDDPLSSKKVEIVALRGHSKAEDLEDLTKEEFCSHTLRERANKRPLLVGKLVIELRNGIGMVDDVCVTDCSSWVKTKMFRLGARMIGEEDQVKEAVSTPFEVKHRRGETDQKHPIPSPEDDVWRLKGIARKGKIRERLEEYNIHKVKDLVLQYHNDQSLLRRILKDVKVSLKMWDTIIQQATSCCCFSGNNGCTNQNQQELYMSQEHNQHQLNQSMALDNSFFDDLTLELCNDIHLTSMDYSMPSSSSTTMFNAQTSSWLP